jgi:uncharacterized protein (DUF2235 family)
MGVTNTDVVHIFSILVHAPSVQVAYYHPGLGTMGGAGSVDAFVEMVSRLLPALTKKRLRSSRRLRNRSFCPSRCLPRPT